MEHSTYSVTDTLVRFRDRARRTAAGAELGSPVRIGMAAYADGLDQGLAAVATLSGYRSRELLENSYELERDRFEQADREAFDRIGSDAEAAQELGR